MLGKKKGKVLAPITERELDRFLKIGQKEDAQYLIDGLMKTMARIERELGECCQEIREKYNLVDKGQLTLTRHTRVVKIKDEKDK